jgi:hypothetical protein
MTEEPEEEPSQWMNHEPEPRGRVADEDKPWNHSYLILGLKYAAMTTIRTELDISETRWLKLDFNKIRVERRFNPHNEEYFPVYCIEDIKKQLGLK